MKGIGKLAFGLFVMALAMAPTGAWAQLDPTGIWDGKVTCDVTIATGKVKTSQAVEIEIDPAGPGFNVIFTSSSFLPVYFYYANWFPNADGKKGTLGFASVDIDGFLFSETGQAKIERKKDGTLSLDGDSFVFLTDESAGNLSAKCEWKFQWVAPL